MRELNFDLYFVLLNKVSAHMESRYEFCKIRTPEITLSADSSGCASIIVDESENWATWDKDFHCCWGKDEPPGVVIQKAVSEYFQQFKSSDKDGGDEEGSE
jgi:hypothetical protein